MEFMPKPCPRCGSRKLGWGHVVLALLLVAVVIAAVVVTVPAGPAQIPGAP
jgi:hypothetical protein